jgi:DNA-directed RNA polymerase subunit RPC12/RpoP
VTDFPTYFFACPKCPHKIHVTVGEGHVSPDTPDDALLSVECEHCGWNGDLPFSELNPLPTPLR